MNIAAHISPKSGWKRFALGDVLTLVNGRAYKQDELLEQGTPVIRIQNLNGGTNWYYSNLNLPDDKYCENGDLLFAWSATFGPYFWNGSRAIYHYHIWKVLPSRLLDKKYAFFLLQSITEKVKASGRGISMIHVTKSGMEAWEVDIPPLSEQQRIAAILDKADELRRKRKRATELLDSLAQSIFLEMFGEPTTNRHSLRFGRIGDLLDEVQYGTSEKAGETGDYPILRMGNVTNDGRIIVNDLKYIDLNEKDVDKFTVRKGDILFNRTNSADLVGKTAVFDKDERFAFAGYLVRARVREGVSPDYISGYLNSRHGKATLRGMAKSIVGMANINAKEMQSIKILIPDTFSQRAFSSALSAITTQRSEYTGQLQSLESLFSSLQQRAFSGQL